ncbi:MAG: putative signal-transduction protein containing cAMP-binding and domain [Planctomycetota bacterium]|nr:putative signal-transduction protein containing cAMP-binding and domain [Planctomycetota bacterium]
MRVRDVLRQKGNRIISIGTEATISDAISELVSNNIGSLPVIDLDGGLVGILSERDVLRAIHEHGLAFGQAKVSDVMTRDPQSSDLDQDVEEVMGKMSHFRIAKVPVLCDSKLCGIVSVGDVIKVLYENVRSENQHLMSYIQGSS